MKNTYRFGQVLKGAMWAVLLLLFSTRVDAQSLANYSVSRLTGQSYSTISNTGTAVTNWRNGFSGDNLSSQNPIGFTFVFNGTPYTQFHASLEGFLSLNTIPAGITGSSAITGYGSDNSLFSTNVGGGNPLTIAPFYDNLTVGAVNTSPSTCVRYQTLGSAPTRRLVVEWADVRTSGVTSTNQSFNFQAILYESTGLIEFSYGNMALGSPQVSPTYSSGLVTTITNQAPNQLLTQNVENTTFFSNAPNNALVTVPATNSKVTFTPPVSAPTGPSVGTFVNATTTTISMSWTDNAVSAPLETGYLIYRSDDGVNYSYAASMPANATTFTDISLLSGTTYFYRIYAVNEGQMSSAFASVSGSTVASPTATSIATGNWNSGSTWSTGAVPLSSQNVVIAAGHTVTINSLSATCNNLTVDGTLRFDNISSAALDVVNNVTVSASGNFNFGTGVTLAHTLRIGGTSANPNNIQSNGNLTVDGTFDMSGSSSVNVIFGGTLNSTVSGSGSVLDFSTVTINKGTSTAAIVNMARSFTVNGANTSGFLSFLNGTFRISGSFAQSNPIFSTIAYVIPANGGFWLDNPNFTVTGQAGSAGTQLGRLRLSQGTFNVGTSADQSLLFTTGATFIIDGASATLNVAGAFGYPATTLAFNYTQTAGNINVATLGNSSANPSFALASAGIVANITGGTVTIVRRAITTGVSPAPQTDYWVGLFGAGFLNMTGGTLRLGNASTPAPNSLITVNSIVNGGTGYAIGQVLNVTGGSFTTTATVTVTSIGAGGVITQAMINNPGVYTTLPSGNITLTGGTGSGATVTLGSGTPFRIRGDIFDLNIDNASTNKSAVLIAQINVRGTTTVNPSTAMALNGFTILYSGTTFVNNGIIDAFPVNSRFTFFGTTPQTYTGTGINSPAAGFSMQNTAGLTLNATIRTQRVNFFNGSINNSVTHNAILGTGSTDVVLQYGNAGGATASGNFATTPSFNVGTAAYVVLIAQETQQHITGPEIPTTTGSGVYARTINILSLTNSLGMQIIGGNLIIGDGSGSLSTPPALTLGGGNVDLNGNNLTIGSSTAIPASLSYTSGLVVGSGSMTRWYNGTVKSAASVDGLFPMGANTNNRSIFINPATALSSGGTVTVSVNSSGGLSPMTSFNEVAGVTGFVNFNNVDTRSNAGWVVSTANGLGNGSWTMRATTSNMIQSFNAGDLRLVSSTAANPIGRSTANTGASPNTQVNKLFTSTALLNNTFHVGTQNSNALAVITAIASGDWGNGTTWNSGTPPTSVESAVIPNGITVTVQGGGSYNASNVTIDNGGTLNQPANTLTISGNLVLNGTYNVSGGNTNIGGAALVTSVTPVLNGTGYAVNDVVTIVGGTGSSATCLVTLVDGAGGILQVNILNPGNYNGLPFSPVSITGGSGSGATFTLGISTIAINVSTTGSYQQTNGNVIVGTTGGHNRTFQNNGITNVSGGNLEINGNAQFAQTANAQFIQFGGNINVDPNSGSSATSVPEGVDAVSFASTPIGVQLNGGTMTIVDPVLSGVGNALSYTPAITTNSIGHTLVLGGSSGTNNSNAVNGFRVSSGLSLRLGHVTVNGGSGSGRFVNLGPGTTQTILGNFTVNSGSIFRQGAVNVNIAGNINNNGTWHTSNAPTTGGLVSLSFAGSGNPVAQSINGSGNFRNATPTIAIAAAGTGYALGDILTVSGGTFTTAATFKVTGVNLGLVTALTLENAGAYTVEPTGTFSLTGGTGSGATATLTTGSFIPTGSFASLTFNNNSFLQGATVNVNNLIVAGTLNTAGSLINLGSNNLTLGTSATALGTLTVGTGFFTSTTGTFTRWFGTGSIVLTTAAGTFPFATTQGLNRTMFIGQTSATGGGTISARFVDASGLSTITPSFVDGSVTVDSRTNGRWAVSSGNGYTSTTMSAQFRAESIFQNVTTAADIRVTADNASAPGVHNASSLSAGVVNVSRANITSALFNSTGAFYLGGNVQNFPVIYTAIASGNWGDAATWDLNAVPVSTANVVIATPYNVTVGSDASYDANGVTVQSNAQLTLAGNTLNIGPAGGGNRMLEVNGGVTISSGTLNVNGYVNFNSGSAFNMSGGNFNIDGNTGTPGSSVASNQNLLNFSVGASGNAINATGGTITIVDPHGNTGLSLAINRPSSSGASCDFSGTTVRFGDGASTTTGVASQGFAVATAFSGGLSVPLGSVQVNAGSAANRFVMAANVAAQSMDVSGTLTINASSELQIPANGSLSINGTLTNNGTLTATGALFVRATGNLSPIASTIGGAGTYRNLATSPTANFTNFTMNNASGVTINSLSNTGTGTVSGTLNMLAGDIDLGANTFTLGTSATSIGTLSYTSGNFVASTGFFSRWVGTSTLTQTGTFLFPFSFVGANRSVNFNVLNAGAITTGGRISARHNGAIGNTNISAFSDNGVSVDRTTNSSWTFNQSGLNLGANSLVPTASVIGVGGFSDVITLRFVNATDNTTTGSSGSGTFAIPAVSRAFPNAVLGAIFNNTAYRVGGNATTATLAPTTFAIATGAWEDVNTWNTGIVPDATNDVVITGGTTVTVDAQAAVCNGIAINPNGGLTVSGSTLNVGSSAFNSGALTMNGGTFNVTGAAGLGLNNFSMATFTMSNGTINVGSATAANRIFHAAGTFAMSGGNLNVFGTANLFGANVSQTGGTISVDPNNANIGGSSATTNSIASAAVSAAGSGYSLGSIVTVTGGTFTQPAQLQVASLSGSTVATVNVINPGIYTAFPTNPVSVTLSSGSGSGATFNLTQGILTMGVTVNSASNLNGGTIQIIDPAVNTSAAGTTQALRITGSVVNNTAFGGTHAIQFGNGVSTTAGNADGFVFETFGNNTNRVPVNHVTISGGNSGNRFLSPGRFGMHVRGNLTISNNSEFNTQPTGGEVVLGGNVSVGSGGNFTALRAITLGSGATYNALNAQTISGPGTYRNATSSPSANLQSVIVNNGNGITLSTPLSLDANSTLALTNGNVHTTLTNLLTLRNPFTTAVSGGSSNSYVVGPMVRRMPASLSGDSTYTYPVGGAVFAPFELVAAKTLNAGNTDVRVSVTDAAPTGSPDNVVLGALNSRYWQAAVTSSPNYFSSAVVRVTEQGLAANNRLARSSTLNGTFVSVSSSPVSPFTNISSDTVTSLGFFAVGSLVNCSGTPNAGTATASSNFVAPGGTAVLTLAGQTAANGITYQWQESNDGISGWANVTGGQNPNSLTYTTAALGGTKFYRCVVNCTFGSSANSNVVGVFVPLNMDYDVTRQTGQTYSSIMSSGTNFSWVGTSTDEAYTAPLSLTALGFNFNYQGVPVTQLRTQVNGFLTFNPATTAGFTNNFAAAGSMGMVAPMWADFVTSPNNNTLAALQGSIKYQLTGANNSQVLTIEWANIEVFGVAGPSLNFQVKLYEATGVIEFLYGNMIATDGNASVVYNYTSGLSALNSAGGIGNFISQQLENVNNFSNSASVNNLAIVPSCNTKVTFTPGNNAVLPTDPGNATLNDNCATATVLTVGTGAGADPCIVHRTAGSTVSTGIPSCTANASNLQQRDVWYSFTLTNTSNVTISVVPGGGYDAVVQLISGACGTQTSVNCVNAAGTGLTESITANGLAAGTYFIRVWGATANSTGYFNLGLNAVLTPPSNDNCAGATALTIGTPINSGNTAGATASTGNPTCALGNGDDDVWYTFTATSTYTRLTVTPVAPYNAVVQVMTGACGSLTNLVTCVNNAGAGGAEILDLATVAATTYRVRVYHSATGSTPSSGFSILAEAPIAACPALTSPSNNLSNVDPAVVNTFNWAASAGPGTGITYTFQVSTSSNFSSLLVNQTGLSTLTTTVAANALAQSTNYFWRVLAVNANGTSSNCTARQFATSGVLPSCATGLVPANGASNQAVTLTLSWGIASGNPTGYDVYLATSQTNVANQAVFTRVSQDQAGNSYLATGLQNNTTYFWKVVPRNLAGVATGCATQSFTTIATPPVNDDCSGAVALTVNGSTLTGQTSANATQTFAPCASTQANDVWYKFTANGNRAQVTVVGASGLNAVVQAYSGSCGSLTPISGTCTNSTGNNGTEYMIATGLTAGQEYFVRVYNANAGTSAGTSFSVKVENIITWSGNSWVGGTPDATTGTTLVRIPTGTSVTLPNGSTIGELIVEGNGQVSVGTGTVTFLGNVSFVTTGLVTFGGTGTIVFGGSGTQTLAGAPVQFNGIVRVATGATLSTSTLILMNSGTLMHGTGTPTGGGSFTGTLRQRRTGSTNPLLYNYWSSPVSGSTLAALNGTNFFSFNSATQIWTSETSAAAMLTGIGYSSTGSNSGFGSAGTRQFSGMPNDGPINVAMSVNPGSNDDWNLVGNPYPSALSGGTFITDNSANIVGPLYFWNTAFSTNSGQNNFTGADYVTRTLANAPFQIGVAQGFFVEATSTSLSYMNSQRNATNATIFRTQSPIQRMTLLAHNSQNVANNTLIAFTADATDQYDRLWDGRKNKGNFEVSLYSRLNGVDMAVNAFGELNAAKVVELGLDVNQTGQHTFMIDQLENVDASTSIYLQDMVTGTMHNLRNSAYVFNATALGTYTGRFYLHFQPLTTSVPTIQQTKPGMFFNADVLRITGLVEGTVVESIQVMDLSGRRVFSAQGLENSGTVEQNVNLPLGVYLIEVSTNRGIFTEKVFKSVK